MKKIGVNIELKGKMDRDRKLLGLYNLLERQEIANTKELKYWVC